MPERNFGAEDHAKSVDSRLSQILRYHLLGQRKDGQMPNRAERRRQKKAQKTASQMPPVGPPPPPPTTAPAPPSFGERYQQLLTNGAFLFAVGLWIAGLSAGDSITAAIFFSIGAIAALVGIWVSPKLLRSLQIVLTLLVLAVFPISWGYVSYRTNHPKADELAEIRRMMEEEKEPAALQGHLNYANVDAKLIYCPIKTGVALGTNLIEATQFPLTVVRIEGKPLVEIDSVEGRLTFKQLYLLDEDDHVIASIHDNDFWVKNGYHAVQHPGQVDLTVFGPNEEMLLRVFLTNPSLLSVEGKFRYRNQVVEIADRQVTIGKLNIRQKCFFNAAFTIKDGQAGVSPELAHWWGTSTN